ncbi:hypothetical protein ACEZ3G_12715 [Maribacter algicola]|uniref:Uncharacterized protein n=1 Tax=Meishania litoralis TaxID=3434685 RepID=A0ACC7LM75_9FLAO
MKFRTKQELNPEKMSENVLLKENPKIEIQFLKNVFQIIDEKTIQNTGIYNYSDLEYVELNKIWFPKLAKWLRIITWIFNGVPYFPDQKSYKKANVIIHLKKENIGIWLTNSCMVTQAKKIKNLLDNKRL